MNRMAELASIFLCLAAVVAQAAAGTLPDGYTEIEYIQGSGSARIVTDYTPHPNTDKIEAVVEWPANTLNASQAVWCSRGSGTQADSLTLFYINDNKKFRFDYMPTGHAVSLVPDFTAATETKYTITAEDNTITYAANGTVLQTQDTPAYPFTAGSVLALFSSHHSGINSNLGNYGKHKLYSFKVWRSGKLIHYFVPCKDSGGAATLVDICDNPATLTKSGSFTAGDAGHYFDDSLFEIPDDTLVIVGSPAHYGSPSPAYGKQTGLVAGDTVPVSCGATVVTNGSTECIYQGWKLCNEDGALLSSGTETSFTYTHPTPADGRKLEWLWKARPVGADATDLLPTLRLTFDGQSLANTGSGSLTMSGGVTTYVESEQGYALDTPTCAPYGSISGVFAANRDSAIAAVAKLGTKSTGILFHFRNGNTSIMLRRGAAANQIVLTENNSSSALITVNDIANGDTEYHLYVVNILQGRVDLYVDGVLAGTTTTTPRASDLVNWQFGGRHGGVISGEAICGGPIDDLRVYASALSTEQMIALGDSLLPALMIRSIPTQHVFPGIRPEPGFTITNRQTGARWVFAEGGVASGATPFDVAYSFSDGKGTVTATGKAGGEAEGEMLTREYVYTDEFLINGGFESGTMLPGWVGSNSSKSYVINASNGHKPNQTTTFITGTYCGMLKSTCSMQQVFTCESLFRTTLSWKCKHRVDYNSGTTFYYKVLLDGEEIYPEEATTGSEVRYRSVEGLILAPGEHTLKFDGRTVNNADTSLFFDDVSLRLTTPLVILPIPDQAYNFGDVCRPEFTVTNVLSAQSWRIGGDIDSGDFDVDYSNNDRVGVATVTATGKGALEGEVLTASFNIFGCLFAKPVVDVEGNGLSWATAMSWTNALAVAAKELCYEEIWLSGDMTLSAAPSTLTFTRPMIIRGGFAGTEVALDERAAGAMSTFDGQGSYTVMTIANGAGAPVVLDGIRIFNGTRGLVKTGAGDLTILNSAIVGNHTSAAGQNGIGLSLTGTADAKLVISNSVVSGNHGTATNVGQGQGLYVTAFGSVLITDTTFLTNGLAWTAANLWNEGRDGQAAAALYLNSVAATVKGCTFRGNRGSSYSNRGGIVRVAGTSGGTLFDHCVFAGNEEDYHWRDETTIPNGGSNGGQIAINLSSETDRVTISNCTLACNFSDNSKSAVGVTVAKGTAVIRNSIIANNIVHYSNSGGADLALMANTAHAEVSYSVLSADGPSSYTSLVEGNLSFGDGVRFGDPKLVSSTNDVNDLLVIISGARKLRQFNKEKLDEVLALDVHALSPAGYFANDGVEHVSDGDYSRAIDAGDPLGPVGDEPSPNGGIVNAGAYGGTAQASKTAPGSPAVSGDVTVSFDEEYSRPTVRFTVGGTGAFFAQAKVFITTNDVDWILVDTLEGLVNGDSVDCAVNAYYPSGYIRAKVVLAASGVSDTATSAATPVTKPLPPWWGKGGPANVIHVRPGAFGTGSGENWLDAVPDLWSAYLLVSADRNEIWIAGTNVLKTGSITLSASNPLVIRGGFHGWENSPEEREDGFRSVIDGDDKTDCLTVANSAALDVERIHFTRGLSCALIKTGAGDMRVSDCHFVTNGTDQATSADGKGARVSGTKTTTVVTFTNCVFRGNRARTGMAGGCAPKGGGINASALKCLRIEDCYFVHNGIYIRSPGGGNSYDPSTGDSSGTAVYSSAPVSAVGCRFVANFGTVRNGNGGAATTSGGFGGSVRLVSGAEGSAFTNCAWVANGDMIVWPSVTAGLNTSGPLVVHFGSASGTVDVERCTFAYNLADGFETTAGLNLIRGTANVHNSIFFGNILGGLSSTRGRDISLREDSVCNVSYTLFGELGSNSVSCAETATTNFLDGIVVGDPLFVTEYATMTNLVKKSGNRIFWDWTTETLPEMYAKLEAADVHLRSCIGSWVDGRLVPYPRQLSPAIDAGDKKSDHSREPVVHGVGGNGGRVNLGAYGNTPEAALSPFRAAMLILR